MIQQFRWECSDNQVPATGTSSGRERDMNRKILGLLAVWLLAGPSNALANGCPSHPITFSTDTSTDVAGSFAVCGGYWTTVGPTIFPWLPNDSPYFWLGRDTNSDDYIVFFGTAASGASPNDPQFLAPMPTFEQRFADMIGMYSDPTGDGTGPDVYWRYYDFKDTGGPEGTFTGNFCFSTGAATCATPSPVPLPAAAWLLLWGLGGLGFLGRRKAA
jgi:hypothetical protein